VSAPPQTLASLLAEAAAALPDATASTGPGAPGAGPVVRTTTWARRGVPFAVLGPTGVELRLDPAIAAAATRTPDTAPSPRGRDWVRFNPRELDAHAIDRLQAWFALAHRFASG
jgi:hypothetical protein